MLAIQHDRNDAFARPATAPRNPRRRRCNHPTRSTSSFASRLESFASGLRRCEDFHAIREWVSERGPELFDGARTHLTRPGNRAAASGATRRNAMIVPVAGEDRQLANLWVIDTHGEYRFDRADRDEATRCAAQIAMAIERVETRAALAAARERLQQRDRLEKVGELASVMAHEVRNALVPLRTAVDLLPERFEDEEFRNWFQSAVGAEVERVRELVDSVSQLRRAPRWDFGRIDLVELLRAIARLLVPMVEGRGGRLQLRLPETPLELCADADALRQVVMNLALNSLKACGDEHVELTLCAGSGDGQIWFAVEDDGPGLPACLQGTLAAAVDLSHATGCGLGLAVASDLVAAHGGRIAGRDLPRGGGCLTVSLPLGGTRRYEEA